MDKKGKSGGTAKPQRAAAALNKAGWPAQPSNEGIKRARSAHDRKPMGRGAVRGR